MSRSPCCPSNLAFADAGFDALAQGPTNITRAIAKVDESRHFNGNRGVALDANEHDLGNAANLVRRKSTSACVRNSSTTNEFGLYRPWLAKPSKTVELTCSSVVPQTKGGFHGTRQRRDLALTSLMVTPFIVPRPAMASTFAGNEEVGPCTPASLTEPGVHGIRTKSILDRRGPVRKERADATPSSLE